MAKDKLSGRWAVVTGASSGIGLEFSQELGRRGCNLLMVSNQPDALESASEELKRQYGVETRTLDVDLSANDAIDRMTAAIDALPATPVMLINNAGIFDFKAVSDLSPRRLNLYIDLHMRIVTLLTREMGERMAAAGGGYILNMSSMSCWMPMPGLAMYSATKAYIRAFSRAYRVEMLDRGVSVTVACPGGIATDLFGLPKKLQKVGVGVGALATPRRFARNAIRRTLRRRKQYINGPINRLAIVGVGILPEWGRRLVKTQLLDRLNKKK